MDIYAIYIRLKINVHTMSVALPVGSSDVLVPCVQAFPRVFFQDWELEGLDDRIWPMTPFVASLFLMESVLERRFDVTEPMLRRDRHVGFRK